MLLSCTSCHDRCVRMNGHTARIPVFNFCVISMDTFLLHLTRTCKCLRYITVFTAYRSTGGSNCRKPERSPLAQEITLAWLDSGQYCFPRRSDPSPVDLSANVQLEVHVHLVHWSSAVAQGHSYERISRSQ